MERQYGGAHEHYVVTVSETPGECCWLSLD